MIFSKATDERIGQLAEAAIVCVGAVTTMANLVIATGVQKGSKTGSDAERLATAYINTLLHSLLQTSKSNKRSKSPLVCTMSSLLQLLKDIEASLPEPDQRPSCSKLLAHNQRVFLTGCEALQAIISGEAVLMTRRKFREIIAAIEAK